MLNDPPNTELIFQNFWFYPKPRQLKFCGDAIGLDKDYWLEKQHYHICRQLCKQDIWLQCRAAGTRNKHLRKTFPTVNIDNLRRTLKAGSVSDENLMIVCRVTGLDPTIVQSPPTPLQRLRICIRTVEVYEHRCRTIDKPLNDADRTPMKARLSLPHGALLHSLTSDTDLLDSWRFQLGASRVITQIHVTPELFTLLDRLFDKASNLIACDANSKRQLDSWHPTHAGFPAALGRIAQAWNPYQLHYFFAHEVFECEA